MIVEIAPDWNLEGPTGDRCPHCQEFIAGPVWSLSGPNLRIPLVDSKVRTQAGAERFARQVLKARGVLT